MVCAVVNTVECACMPYSHGSFNLEGGLEREIEGLGRARRGGRRCRELDECRRYNDTVRSLLYTSLNLNESVSHTESVLGFL